LLYIYRYYSEFLRRFLSIKAFQIPYIGNTPIERWLEVVRYHVKDVVGFESGLFYDMLAANAYATQIDDNRKPLMKEQVENIEDYYKTRNSDIARILLDKNEKLLKLLGQNNDLKINLTPSVPLKELLTTILSKYRGKVVLVDFWATWCGPCMKAHREMSSIKEELKRKGVVFVYIADNSSPKQLWEGKIKGIGGEQYYLTAKEIHYIWGQLKLGGRPTYLIYDRKGQLKQKVLGFPGIQEMKKYLEM
jgi:thiol-disulfide isomerase/thioredoxin